SAAQTHEHNRSEPDPAALAREVLRLRVRWVQELQVRVAMELGRRLVARGQLDAGGRSPAAVRDVPLDELLAAVDDPSRHARVDPTEEGEAPLPARFRLSSDGAVVPEVA